MPLLDVRDCGTIEGPARLLAEMADWDRHQTRAHVPSLADGPNTAREGWCAISKLGAGPHWKSCPPNLVWCEASVRPGGGVQKRGNRAALAARPRRRGPARVP